MVRCDLRRGVAELAGTRVEPGAVHRRPSAADLVAGQVRYPSTGSPGPASRTTLPAGGAAAADARWRSAVSGEARDDGGPAGGRRPAAQPAHLPRALGYVKTHHRQYLPPELTAVVTGAAGRQRSPVFLLGTAGPAGPGTCGCPAPPGRRGPASSGSSAPPTCSRQEAIELADLSAVTLPRFASTPYKDPRAPQNLIPIAGLERRLRGLLGDARLLHRALALAAQGAPVHR